MEESIPVRFPLPWKAAIGTKSKESPMLLPKKKKTIKWSYAE